MEKEVFEKLFFESILEYFIEKYFYQDFKNTEYSAISPYNYYRFNKRNDILFFQDLSLNPLFWELEQSQIHALQETIKKIQNNKFSFRDFLEIKGYDFLFREKNLLFPENFTSEEIQKVELLLETDPFNLFLLQAYVIYYYNRGRLDLDDYFSKIFQLDVDNPYIMARYSRYLASALYKLDKNTSKLLEAENNLLKAINILGERSESFFYSWLACIYIEFLRYEEALKLIEKCLLINQQNATLISDPFYWKTLILYRLWRYQNSLDTGLFIEQDAHLQRPQDFRFFRVMASNYLSLDVFEKFQEYCLKSIRASFILMESYNITYKWHTYQFNKNTDRIHLQFRLDQNALDSFLLLFPNIEWEEKILFLLAFFYKEQCIYWREYVMFNGTRELEILAFNYLELVYDGKIKFWRSL